MASRERPDVEQAARSAFDAGQVARATTILLEAYGPELLGFVRWLLRDDARGDEAFADCALDAWRGLGTFDWRSNARTWLYAIARRAAARAARDRRPGPHVPLTDGAFVSEVLERVRTETAPYLRTDIKSEVRRLRQKLTEADQLLLVLRVDRRLSWKDVSVVLADEPLDEPSRQAFETRLRKRYQLVKDRLRMLARESGLLSR